MGRPRTASKKFFPLLILETSTKTPIPINAEKSGCANGVSINLNKPNPPEFVPELQR